MVGYKFFGIVMWAAAITSVIGAAYTSVSFIQTFSPVIEKNKNLIIIAFIAISTIVFITIGRPVDVLVIVGALNALILPIALGSLLVAVTKKRIVGDYKHPKWLLISGVLVVIVMTCMGIYTIIDLF
jgi:Mn2+/Fe2+ NRAMP family transporter